jgi:hypothetical protein
MIHGQGVTETNKNRRRRTENLELCVHAYQNKRERNTETREKCKIDMSWSNRCVSKRCEADRGRAGEDR